MANKLSFVLLYALSLSATLVTCDETYITSHQIVDWIKDGSIPSQINPSNEEIDELVRVVEVEIAKNTETTSEKGKNQKGEEKNEEEIMQKTSKLDIKENTEIMSETEESGALQSLFEKADEKYKAEEEEKKRGEEEKKKKEEEKKKKEEEAKKLYKMKAVCKLLLQRLSRATLVFSYPRGQITWNGQYKQAEKEMMKDIKMLACYFEEEAKKETKSLSVVFLPAEKNAGSEELYFVIENASSEEAPFRFLGIYKHEKKTFKRSVSFEEPNGSIIRANPLFPRTSFDHNVK